MTTCTRACSKQGLPVGVSVLCPGWVRTQIADAERNWPAELGEAPTPAPGTEFMFDILKRVIDEGMPPAVVADKVADAVEAEKFWVLPHPDFVEIAVKRWHDIAEGVNPRHRSASRDSTSTRSPRCGRVHGEAHSGTFCPGRSGSVWRTLYG